MILLYKIYKNQWVLKVIQEVVKKILKNISQKINKVNNHPNYQNKKLKT